MTWDEVVRYDFRHFKSPSQKAQPPLPFPDVFRGPSQFPYLAPHCLVPTHTLLAKFRLTLSGWLISALLHELSFALSFDFFHVLFPYVVVTHDHNLPFTFSMLS